MARYLADTSIWAWSNKRTRPDIASKLAERLERGEIWTCVLVVLESMHRAETGEEYQRVFDTFFRPLDWLPLHDAASLRARDLQRELAGLSHGNHRRPAIDFLIAAAAEAQKGVVLWFFDRDLEAICHHTGQPYEAEASTGPGH